LKKNEDFDNNVVNSTSYIISVLLIMAINKTKQAQFFLQDLGTKQDQGTQVDLFACPICYEPLIRKGPVGLNL
jgi:hypothetical protein